MKHRSSFYFLLSCLLLLNTNLLEGQWTNRYPKVDGYGHHVYLEGHELPVMNAGPMDPAPSPKNDKIVFSAKGWLWIMDLSGSSADRITFSPDIDSRPNWSPQGDQIVFIRDNGLDTRIVLLDLPSGGESDLVDTDALELDPIFSMDGQSVYYASAENGSIDIWRIELASGQKNVITREGGLERLPVPNKRGDQLIYLKKKGFSYDSVELLDLESGTSKSLAEENFVSLFAFSLSPDDRTLAYTWPDEDDYELRLLDIITPSSRVLLTSSEGLPLAPKFSQDGQWVYYAEYNKDERSEIKRIHVNGGLPQTITPKKWEYREPMGRLKIISNIDDKVGPVRMSIVDANGHPIIPETGILHSDGQNGTVFFYSPGEIEVSAGLGEVTITAVHGFATEQTIQKVNLDQAEKVIEINLHRIWDANGHGWYSGDNHFHLNYGGTSHLDPEDIILDLKAEDIDIAFPLLANLGNRFLEQGLWGWKHDTDPIIHFGQEIRSHFLGHLGLIGTKELYWPWVWGPQYDVYGRDDRLNADPLQFAHDHGGLGSYVHPVDVQNPFAENNARAVPVSFVADAVLGEADLIELGCLWTDEIGTGALWHRVLNIGIPLAISAGSDVMNDLYRTMAIGATRVYVKPEGDLTVSSYLDALKNGKSFVTNGPQLEFIVDGKEVGEVIQSGRKKVQWTLSVHSPIKYNKVEIFVNGEVKWSRENNKKTNSQSFKGSVDVPSGGWITARVSGGLTIWPVMDSYPFAESSPIWFYKIGSVSPAIARKSAQDLLDVLGVSEQLLMEGYGDNPIPRLRNHFEEARQKLLLIIAND